MSDTLYFATTNSRKIKEVNAAAKLYGGIDIKPVNVETKELQSDSAKELTVDKAKQAYAQINKPVVVTDTFWSIPALNGFPGAYMKFASAQFEAADWIALMDRHKDKTIIFSENIAFFNGKKAHFITKAFEGRVVKPRGKGNTSIEEVAEFNGHTLAEAHEVSKTSHDPEEYIWYDFLKWYKEEYHP